MARIAAGPHLPRSPTRPGPHSCAGPDAGAAFLEGGDRFEDSALRLLIASCAKPTSSSSSTRAANPAFSVALVNCTATGGRAATRAASSKARGPTSSGVATRSLTSPRSWASCPVSGSPHSRCRLARISGMLPARRSPRRRRPRVPGARAGREACSRRGDDGVGEQHQAGGDPEDVTVQRDHQGFGEAREGPVQRLAAGDARAQVLGVAVRGKNLLGVPAGGEVLALRGPDDRAH